MKTYETWEVLKLLSENPGLKFENTQEFPNRDPSIIRMFVDENGYIELETENCSDEISGNIPVSGEWKFIKEPISFIEAIRAYHEGKEIYCLLNDVRYDYKPYKGDKAVTGGYILGKSISSGEILNGKWYVEEE